ncbi:MAG: hypothetical protein ABIJ92_00810 [Candidatus Aenigmatarchaeota archaeon]
MEDLEKIILRTLLRHNKIGENYTKIQHATSKVPNSTKSADIKKAIKNLRNAGWIELHKKNTCISLTGNRGRIEEIKKLIGFTRSLFSLLF